MQLSPIGLGGDEQWYLIGSPERAIGFIRHEKDAKLIVAAPEMYRLLQNFAYPEEPYDTRQAELSNKVWELLRRIDGKEEIAAHEGTN